MPLYKWKITHQRETIPTTIEAKCQNHKDIFFKLSIMGVSVRLIELRCHVKQIWNAQCDIMNQIEEIKVSWFWLHLFENCAKLYKSRFFCPPTGQGLKNQHIYDRIFRRKHLAEKLTFLAMESGFWKVEVQSTKTLRLTLGVALNLHFPHLY